MKEFEQSYLDARFANPEYTLAATRYKIEKIKFGQFLFLTFFEKKKTLKNHKKRHFSITKKKLSSHTWTPDLQPPKVP